MRTSGWLWLVLVGLLVLGATPGSADDSPSDSPEKASPADGANPGEPADAPKGPMLAPIVTLREAAKTGVLDVTGFKPSSYRRVHLRMRNTGPEAMRIDLCGSHLRPTSRGSCQRLGLGPVVTPRSKSPKRKATKRKAKRPRTSPSGTVVVMLKPGEEKTVQINTCCLDAGRPAPSDQEFTVSKKKLPAVREKVLRWWADNPMARQGAVNSAIWQNRETVHGGGGTDFTEAPVAKAVAGHGGSVYTLRSNGELMMIDPEGIERFLGTDILAVFPTASAVYAEAPGPTVHAAHPAPRELWRLVLTGDKPWAQVATIPHDLVLRDLQVSPNGAIFVTTSRGLYRVDVPTKSLVQLMATEHPDHLSLRFGKKGRVSVTKLRPRTAGYHQGGELKGQSMAVCELYELNSRTGNAELAQAFWNVRQIQTGPLGLYALTPAGKLRRLVGRSLRNAPGQVGYDRILAVGSTCVWLENKQGRLVAVDKAGRLRHANGPSLDRAIDDWALDRYSDEIVFVKSRKYWRMHPKTGEITEVAAPQRR